jgi:hypothetical protein
MAWNKQNIVILADPWMENYNDYICTVYDRVAELLHPEIVKMGRSEIQYSSL